MHAAATGRVSKGGPEGPEGPEGSLPNMLGRRPDGAALGGHGPARPAHACTCIRRLLPHRDHGDDPCEAHCPAKVTSARALAFPVPNRFQPAFSLNHPVNKYVGRTADTPAFAVDCIEKWWRTEGRKRYPEAKTLQILADGGGSNSCTARAWKFNLQHRFCNRHGLPVRVTHYPPATSKWNPIEHRLFCEISKNWAGRPLDSFETILKYLRTTRTSTGLRVSAHLVQKTYETGVKVTDAQMRELRITPNSVLPKWNYTIEPM